MKFYILFLIILLFFPSVLASEIVFNYDFSTDTLLYAGVQDDLLPGQGSDGDVYVGVEYTLIRSDGMPGQKGTLLDVNRFPYDGEHSLQVKIDDGVNTHYVNLGFCNFNGLCEPCLESGCNFMENSLSCEDCSPTDLDGYCDISSEDVCDPDCGNVLDNDCKSFETAKSALTKRTALEYSFTTIGLFLLIIFLILVVLRRLYVVKRRRDKLVLLLPYVKEYRTKGYDDASIRHFFMEKGYTETFINEIFKTLEK